MKTLKILGLLLTYPSRDLIDALPEMSRILHDEKWLSESEIAGIDNLISWMTMTDLLDVQESYAGIFDRTPSLCLHLFEHVHGDSRDRGQAMVDLADVYREKGYKVATEEMPDYLPLFLEFLSTQPIEDARENLDNTVDILSALRKRLEKRESPYAAVFAGIEATAGRKPDVRAVEKALKAASGQASTPEELDLAWEEQFAFGDSSADNGCPKARDMLARMGSDPIQIEKAGGGRS